MTGYKRVNYYELCRLCTSSQPKDKIHIFREEGRKMQLQHKIQFCFPLLVCENDYLPKVVCTTCIETLDQCYMFRQKCINSETMLSSYFSNYRFTDDFKKDGKVYVKDTGEKNENNQNIKEIVQENLSKSNYLTVDLPSQNKNCTKIPVPVPQKHIKLINVNSNQNISTSQKNKSEQLKPNLKTSEQLNILASNVTSLSSNSNLETNNKNFVQNPELNTVKNNVTQLMLIDVEQLIKSSLPESEENKIKEALLKQQNSVENSTESVLNNVNNNNNNNNKKSLVSSTKIYKCDICDKIFKRREHLYQHNKLHSGLRPFNCIHCMKTFSRKEHLMRHLTSHSGVKDFSCEICSKKFSRPDNLKKHKKTHQKSGQYICDICKKSFVIKHYYLAHKLQHHDEEQSWNKEEQILNKIFSKN